MRCAFCGYDTDASVTWSAEVLLPFAWLSGNIIGTNGKGRLGWRYQKYRTEFRNKLFEHTTDIKEAKQYRRVIMTRRYGKGRRKLDKDNLIIGGKPLRDCLSELGLLVDDTPACCDVYPLQEKSKDGKDYVHILIEELDL